MPIVELHVSKVLAELGLTMEQVHPHKPVDTDIAQFIDLCILLGCDYCDSIRGIGPKRALEFIRKYNSLEKVKHFCDWLCSFLKILEVIDRQKFGVPGEFPYQDVRELFKNPEVTPADKVEVCTIDAIVLFN